MAKLSKSLVTPRLRFKEFRNAKGWGEKKLGDEGEFLSSLNGKSGDDFDVGEAKFITYMNVFSNTFVAPEVLRFVDVKEDESQNKVVSGDVFFTISSETPAEVGMSSVLLQEIDNCYLNSFCALFRFSKNKQFNPIFTGYMLRQPLVRNYFEKKAQGSTRFNLSKDVFKSLPIFVPQYPEQQKIANCLYSLDEIITAQGRKVEALKLYKRCLMQQLFPQESKTLPRLRFPVSASKKGWQKKKISLVLERLAEPVSLNPDTMYREIGIRSHGKGIFHKGATSGKQIGDKRVFHVVQDAFVLSIVFAWEQAVAMTSKNEIGMIASHRFPMYVAKSNQCDVRFIKEFFLTKTGKYLLWWASPGGAGRNKTLGQKEFENLEISLPIDVKEQSRIADCLASADRGVVTEAAKLMALQAHKKGLMQQLFPSPVKD